MAGLMKPIRRVVTGNDAQGRSKVLWDGPAPKVNESALPGRGHTDMWVWDRTPASLAGQSDDGNMPYVFPAPPDGGHFRVIQAVPRPANYDPAKDPEAVASHEVKMRPAGRAWDRGGNNAFTSAMHKTESIDYGIVLEGERVMILDDREIMLNQGDIVIQVGAWHQWRHPNITCLMAFDMFPAKFVDGPAGVAQGSDAVMRADPARPLPPGVKQARRVVTIDREPGKSSLVSDGASPDVRFDPARPGFASARLWVTDSLPAKIVYETLHLPHTLEPPPRGSVCRVLTIPPDDAWRGKVGAADVQAFFKAMGSPQASIYSPRAPHPYMQRTRTLDCCCILSGEVVLVLDTQEVNLKGGDIVVQRGANHAWSNRSGRPAIISVASHDAA